VKTNRTPYTSWLSPIQFPSILAYSPLNNHVFHVFHASTQSFFGELPMFNAPAEELCGELQGFGRSARAPPLELALIFGALNGWYTMVMTNDYGRSGRCYIF